MYSWDWAQENRGRGHVYSVQGTQSSYIFVAFTPNIKLCTNGVDEMVWEEGQACYELLLWKSMQQRTISLSHTLIKVVATMIGCLPNTNHSSFHHLQIRIHLLKSLLCTACTKYKEMLIWQHLYYQIILIYIFIQYYTCITEITALYRTIYFVKSDKPKQKMYTVKSHSSACLDHTEVSVI